MQLEDMQETDTRPARGRLSLQKCYDRCRHLMSREEWMPEIDKDTLHIRWVLVWNGSEGSQRWRYALETQSAGEWQRCQDLLGSLEAIPEPKDLVEMFPEKQSYPLWWDKRFVDVMKRASAVRGRRVSTLWTAYDQNQ
jgi:hypothetical protein